MLLVISDCIFAEPGAVDPLFQTQILGGSVYAIAVQPDGKIVVGGGFTNVNGAPRHRLARLNPDGSLDADFNDASGVLGPAFPPTKISALVLQPDGKIILGGVFTNVAGFQRSLIARLNANGTLDLQFDAGSNQTAHVRALALQPDGKVLALGSFASIGGAPRNGFARLNEDGSADPTFNSTNDVANPIAASVALQSEGKVLVGSNRLHTNGITDLSFNCSLFLPFNYCDRCYCAQGAAALPIVACVTAQPSGKVLIAGAFLGVNGVARNHIARLGPDGNVDDTFTNGVGPNGYVGSVAAQLDGAIIVGGCFSSFNGVPRPGLARLNPNGALDTTFTPVTIASNSIFAVAIQKDGRVLIGGSFTNVGGAAHFGIARLKNDLLLFDPEHQNSVFNVSCATSTGKTYRLEYKQALADSDWNNGPILEGNGFTRVFTDPSATGSTRFYRVREE